MEEAEPTPGAKAAILARRVRRLLRQPPRHLSTRKACPAKCAASPRTRPGPPAAPSRSWSAARGIDIDHLTVTSCDADTLFPQQYFECPDLPLRHRPEALPPLLAGADLLLQQHLAGAGAAARAERPQRPHPPQPPQPPAQRPVLAVHLQPLDAHGARRRLLGHRRHPRGLAHVPQVLLPPRRHRRGRSRSTCRSATMARSHTRRERPTSTSTCRCAAGPGAPSTSPTSSRRCSRRHEIPLAASASCASGTCSRTTSPGRRSGSSSPSAACCPGPIGELTGQSARAGVVLHRRPHGVDLPARLGDDRHPRSSRPA